MLFEGLLKLMCSRVQPSENEVLISLIKSKRSHLVCVTDTVYIKILLDWTVDLRPPDLTSGPPNFPFYWPGLATSVQGPFQFRHDYIAKC